MTNTHGTSSRKKLSTLHQRRAKTGSQSCPAHIRTAKQASKQIVEKFEICEGGYSDGSSYGHDPDANQSGEYESEGLYVEVDKTQQAPQEKRLLETEIGRSVLNIAPVVLHDNTSHYFSGDLEVDKGFVDQQNLADVLGNTTILKITRSNYSAATTARRATRNIVTPKSGHMM